MRGASWGSAIAKPPPLAALANHRFCPILNIIIMLSVFLKLLNMTLLGFQELMLNIITMLFGFLKFLTGTTGTTDLTGH
jgi:hypothetical protein